MLAGALAFVENALAPTNLRVVYSPSTDPERGSNVVLSVQLLTSVKHSIKKIEYTALMQCDVYSRQKDNDKLLSERIDSIINAVLGKSDGTYQVLRWPVNMSVDSIEGGTRAASISFNVVWTTAMPRVTNG